MNSKIKIIISSLTLSAASWALPAVNIVELNLNQVFAPVVGFDDNDMVQVVLDGYLPNACYSQGRSEFDVNSDDKTILIRQYAELSVTGACAHPEALPDELKAVVPFSAELNIGQLNAGNYKILYSGLAGPLQRALNIEIAPTTTVDSLRYATVINAFVNDFVPATDPEIEIRLTIQLNSSCSLVSDKAQIIVQEGVIVVLPEIIKDQNTLCLPVSRPSYKIFRIANPGPGRYLLHVRSLGGNAKNKLFSIISN